MGNKSLQDEARPVRLEGSYFQYNDWRSAHYPLLIKLLQSFTGISCGCEMKVKDVLTKDQRPNSGVGLLREVGHDKDRLLQLVSGRGGQICNAQLTFSSGCTEVGKVKN